MLTVLYGYAILWLAGRFYRGTPWDIKADTSCNQIRRANFVLPRGADWGIRPHGRLREATFKTGSRRAGLKIFFAQSPAQMIHYELIFEEALLIEYLHECKKAGLNVRVIYIRHCDCSDAPPQQAQFLGCDLLYPSVPYYSVLHEERDDVLRSGLSVHLNFNGLFDTSSHLREFIDWRRANVKGDGTDGEPLVEMIPAELYLFKDFD